MFYIVLYLKSGNIYLSLNGVILFLTYIGIPLEIHKELFEEESLVFFISIVNIINRTKQVK